MDKSKRLIEMMMIINAKRKFTIRELSDEFNVSRRTVIRDLQELSELGVPLYSEPGPNGGYKVLKTKILPPIVFSEEEAVAMFFAYQTLEHYRDLPFKKESLSALKKFYHYLSDEVKEKIDAMKGRISFQIPKHKKETPYLREVLEASIKQEVLSISYGTGIGRPFRRSIQPIGLYTVQGVWYCPAYCFVREDYRVFRVDRFKELQPVDSYLGKKDFSQVTIHSWHTRIPNNAAAVTLKVNLTAEGVRRCDIEHWAEENFLINEDGSGVLSTAIKNSELEYLSDYFLGFGCEATVLEPAELVGIIKKKLAKLSNVYNLPCK